MKRWPLLRHLRYLWLRFWFTLWWRQCGRYFWLAPNAADVQHLERVWRGEA